MWTFLAGKNLVYWNQVSLSVDHGYFKVPRERLFCKKRKFGEKGDLDKKHLKTRLIRFSTFEQWMRHKSLLQILPPMVEMWLHSAFT